MKTTVLRAAVNLLALASVALARAGAVHAADPIDTIGITVDPGTVDIDAGRTVSITNRGTVAMDFTFDLPDGWTVEPTRIDALPAGETAQVSIGGYGASGRMTVSGTASRPAGTSGFSDRSTIEMSVRIAGGNVLLDAAPFALGGLALVAVALIVWRTKPWQLRLSRRPSGWS